MLVIILIFLAALLFLRVGIHIEAERTDEISLMLKLSFGPISVKRHLRLIHSANGYRMVSRSGDGEEHTVPPGAFRNSRATGILHALKQCDHARQLLMRSMKLHELRGYLCIAGADAARTSLLVQLIRAGCRFLYIQGEQTIRLQILPDYFRQRSTFRLRCIVSWRLGIIVIASILISAALTLQQSRQVKEAA